MGVMKDGRLQWTEEDTKAVEQYKADLAAGKIKTIILPLDGTNLKEFFENAKDSDFSCGNCGCVNQKEGSDKDCQCPCHKPGGCNFS